MNTENQITSSVNIKEIFTSIQGEGPYVGVNQLFIRFCKCNLNCNYCDTDFTGGMEFFPNSLKEYIKDKIETVHSISLTGGEPLLFADFLMQFLPLVNKPIYLETNATLPEELEKIIKYVDIISADIKLPSSTGMPELWQRHDEFFKIAEQYCEKVIDLFAKVVFNSSITDDEIENVVMLCQKYNLELILQPQTVKDKIGVNSADINKIFNKFLEKYERTRLIPQVHKFIGVE